MKRLGILLVLLAVSFGVLADISISEPLDVYNLGDRLNIDSVCGNAGFLWPSFWITSRDILK